MSDPIPDTARSASVQYLKSVAAIEKEVESLIEKAPDLDDACFWRIVGETAAVVADTRYATPIEEVVRRAVMGESEHTTYQSLLSFIREYRNKKWEIYDVLENVETNRLDDALDYMIDSLPLLGKKAFADLLAMNDGEWFEFEARHTDDALANIVFH